MMRTYIVTVTERWEIEAEDEESAYHTALTTGRMLDQEFEAEEKDADRTQAAHYLLIERNGSGRQNWKSAPIPSLQEAFEDRARWESKSTRLVGETYEVHAVMTDGSVVVLM